LVFVEQVSVVRSLEHSKNRRRGIGGQRGGLAIGHTADRLEVVLDRVASGSIRTTVTLDAALLKDRIDVGKDNRWLRAIPLFVAPRENEQGHQKSSCSPAHWFGKNPP
jgi:hypothetical protein